MNINANLSNSFIQYFDPKAAVYVRRIHHFCGDLTDLSVQIMRLACSSLTACQLSGVGDDAEEEQNAIDSKRQWTIGQMCGLLKVPACDEALALSVLNFLALVAFFTVQKAGSKSKSPQVKAFSACTAPITDTVRETAIARLTVLATEVLPYMTVTASEQKVGDDDAMDEDTKSTSEVAGARTDKKKGNGKVAAVKVVDARPPPTLLPQARFNRCAKKPLIKLNFFWMLHPNNILYLQ